MVRRRNTVPAGATTARKALRRSFVVFWFIAGLAGALNHGVALTVFGRRFDLELPHLRYGYVMFNRIPREISVLQYVTTSGERGYLADLVATPALGYRRARLAMDAWVGLPYIEQVCRRVQRDSANGFRVVSQTYQIGPGQHTLRHGADVPCGRSRNRPR